jgi:C4-dicarboxylate-specific signal transduction histidine kinase
MAQIRGAKLSALGEMAGGIAHEINNPLAIIVGRISQVRRKVETGKIETQSLVESLTKVEDTAMRIAKIIKGLRSFSRDAGKDPMEKMKIPSVVEDALELCRERFRNHNIELRVSLGDSQEIYALGRPTQITQVLVNLLGNAFDATEGLPEKWVALDLIRSGKNVQLRVTDSGKGIPLEVAEKIMQPFFTTKPVGKGTGLGLSISKGIIEEHHGRLFYDSSSPNTRFVIELPCFQSPTQVVA